MFRCPNCPARFGSKYGYDEHAATHARLDENASNGQLSAGDGRTVGEQSTAGAVGVVNGAEARVGRQAGATTAQSVFEAAGPAGVAAVAGSSEVVRGTGRTRPSDNTDGEDVDRARKRVRVTPAITTIVPGAHNEAAAADKGRQIADDSELSAAGLTVNTFYRMIICAQAGCGYAIYPSSSAICKHLKSHGAEVRESTVTTWLERYKIPSGPVIPAAPCTAIAGIDVKDGAVCEAEGCGFATADVDRLRTSHRTAVHGNAGEVRYRLARVQQAYRAPGFQQYIEVVELPAPPAPETASDRIAIFVNTHKDALTRARQGSYLGMGVKETSPWIVRSGIAKFAEPYTQRELIGHSELTVMPDSAPLWMSRLAALCERYFDTCMKLLDTHADDLVLRHLRSKTAEVDVRPLSPIETVAKYQSIFGRLVLFTVRSSLLGESAPCALTVDQERLSRALHKLCGADEMQDDDAVTAIHDLAFSMVAHEYDGRASHSTALIAYVFLASLERFHGVFLPPHHVTPYTAALSFAIRCVVYFQIVRDSSASGATTFKAMAGHLHWVKVGEPHVFDAMRQVHDLARNISLHTASPDRVFWTAGNRSSFRYCGTPITLSALQSMVQGMASRADQLLASLTRHADTSALELPDMIYDDPSSVQVGYSFVSDPRNAIDSMAFTDQLLASGQYCSWLVGQARPVWKPAQCREWREGYLELSALRAALMHTCGGQPPRGTEALETLMVNSDRRRSLIVTEHPELLWVLDYNKSGEVTGGFDRTIIRGLDRALSRLVMVDMAFLRPFAMMLASEVFRCSADSVMLGLGYLNKGLFDTAVTTKVVSGVMQKYSRENVKTEITVSDWRHIMTSLSRHLISDQDVATTAALQEDLDYQEGHSSLTARLHYGRERNGLTSDLVNRFLPLSRCVHKILRRPLSVAVEDIPAEDGNAGDGQRGGADAQAAAIASAVAETLTPQLRALAVDEAALASNVLTLLEARLRSLTSDIMGQVGAILVDALRREGYMPHYSAPAAASRVQPAVVLDLRGRDLLSSLRDFLGIPEGAFRSPSQRSALEEILRGGKNTATFLPTAGGKSILWLLPCAHYNRPTDVTIVYVPWVVLAHAHLRATRKHGVAAAMWTIDNPTFQMVTYVVPESGSSASFHAALRELAAAGRLRRFFVDEVHAWVTDSSYRPAMLDMSEMASYGIPIHLLSATVPLDVYDRALVQLGIASIAQPVMFRERSARLSLRFCTYRLRRADFVTHIKMAAARLLTGEGDRGIVFVRGIAEAETVAQALGCDAFHSDLLPDRRAHCLESWEAGAQRLIVATTLLGTGYHSPGVRLVVEHGPAWNYISHIQGAGRGGRGDTYCEVHTLLDPSNSYMTSGPDVFGHGEMMECLLNDDMCLRQAASQYLDGYGERCDSLPPSYVPCSRCAPLYTAPASGEPILARRVDPRPQTGKDSAEPGAAPSCDAALRINAALISLGREETAAVEGYMKQRLEMLRTICRGCWLRGGGRRADHTTAGCLHDGNIVSALVESSSGQARYADVKGLCHVDGRVVCIWCWVPRTPGLHLYESRHGSQCVYEDVIPQVCLGAWMTQRDFLAGSKDFPTVTATSSFAAYWGWIGERSSGDKYPNAVHAFLTVVDHVLEGACA